MKVMVKKDLYGFGEPLFLLFIKPLNFYSTPDANSTKVHSPIGWENRYFDMEFISVPWVIDCTSGLAINHCLRPEVTETSSRLLDQFLCVRVEACLVENPLMFTRASVSFIFRIKFKVPSRKSSDI